jgi:hypothetical protein
MRVCLVGLLASHPRPRVNVPFPFVFLSGFAPLRIPSVLCSALVNMCCLSRGTADTTLTASLIEAQSCCVRVSLRVSPLERRSWKRAWGAAVFSFSQVVSVDASLVLFFFSCHRLAFQFLFHL